MSQLRRLTIMAKDPNQLADFYRQVFDLNTVTDDTSGVLLSDGTSTLALLDNRNDQALGLYASGFSVENLERIRDRMRGRVAKDSLSAWKATDPDGNLIDLAQMGLGISPQQTPFPIRHIALYTPNPQRLADFYGDLFEMRVAARTDRSSIFVSDGYFNLALLLERPGEERLGLNHFGFHVKDIEEMLDRAERAGGPRGTKRPDRIPYAEYRLHDPEGNGIDVSVKGWQV